MKIKILYSVIISICICTAATFIALKTGILAPMVAQADSNKPSPNFVTTRDDLKKVPIVKDKILTANNNYKSFSGTVIVNSKANNLQSKIDVWIAQPDKFRIEYTPNVNQPEYTEVAVNDGKTVQSKNSKDGKIKTSDPVKKMSKPQSIEDNEIVPDFNGTFLPIGGINELIHPEMLEGVFRSGKLTTTENEQYLNRKVTIMRIDQTDSKAGNCQKFWVDNETGIILKAVLYNNDEVIYSVAFQSINFSNGVDLANFKLLK
jgi:outer membrane lipoprotein-sorting protein